MTQLNVFIVDDSHKTANFFADLLRAEGYHVDVAYDGQEALDYFAKNRPDITFLDLVMPIMDGEKALVEIKKQHPESKIIMMASPLSSDEVLFNIQLLSLKEKGANGFIQKPYTLEQLISKIT